MIWRIAVSLVLVVGGALAQTAASTRVMGAVTEIMAANMTVKPDSGEPVVVTFTENTKFVRIAPGERDLAKATAITQADIGRGDRVLTVFSQKDPGSALRVVVMSQTDIAAKQAKERAEWQKRGISGVVSAVDKGAHEIKIRIPSMMGVAQVMTISLGEQAALRRYAPDSIKFSDAKPATLDEVKVGDQLRALGDKSEDGTRFTAQEVVTGAFKTVAATVVSVSADNREVQVLELNTKKPLTVVVAADSTVKRMFDMGGAPGGPGAPGGATGPSGAPGGPGSGGGGGAGGPGGRRPDVAQMMERMPKSTVAEIKPGEMIIVASTEGASSDRLTAITLLANADGLIRMQEMMAARQGANNSATRGAQGAGGGMGSWNLGGEMSMPIQ